MKQFIVLILFLAGPVFTYAQPQIGTRVPDIALPDVSGETIRLSSLSGKVVIIDFWASWCRPCRQANKQMRSVYKKYKDKGLAVYGISIDDNERSWKQAIANDKITWLQVIDKEASQGNELLQTWGIRYIPSSFLLDRQGNLIAINPDESELAALLKKLL